MSPEDRSAFLVKNGSDPLVASALLTAPSWLSGLSESEAAMIRAKLEKQALSPEAVEAKTLTTREMIASEKGWKAALNLIAERAKTLAEKKVGKAESYA